MHPFIIFTFILASLVACETTSTSSSSSSSSSSTTSTLEATSVWVTGTNKDGVLTTTQSRYTQQFTSFFLTIQSPLSGEIGLGSASGEVGHIRTYSMVTLNGAGRLGESTGLHIFTNFLIPILSAVFGILML